MEYTDEYFGTFKEVDGKEEIAAPFTIHKMPVELRICIADDDVDNVEKLKEVVESLKSNLKKYDILDLDKLEKKYREVLIEDTFESAVDWTFEEERPIKTKQEYSDRIYMSGIEYFKYDDMDKATLTIEFDPYDENDRIFGDEWMRVHHFLDTGELRGEIV